MKKCAIYARVSTTDQRVDSLSIFLCSGAPS
jgi:hypothetical protein